MSINDEKLRKEILDELSYFVSKKEKEIEKFEKERYSARSTSVVDRLRRTVITLRDSIEWHREILKKYR